MKVFKVCFELFLIVLFSWIVVYNTIDYIRPVEKISYDPQPSFDAMAKWQAERQSQIYQSSHLKEVFYYPNVSLIVAHELVFKHDWILIKFEDPKKGKIVADSCRINWKQQVNGWFGGQYEGKYACALTVTFDRPTAMAIVIVDGGHEL